MKPIEFEGVTHRFGANQAEYQTLPAKVAYCQQYETEVVISCWELTDVEALELFMSKRLWVMQMPFGNKLQPLLPSCSKPEL